MNKKYYAITVKKLVKNKNGKYKNEIKHETFIGTWDELEQYLEKNHFILEGWDYCG